MLRIVIAAVLSLTMICVSPATFAAAQADKGNELATAGPKKRLATIVFAGLAGAILGLSTLSFYGRPQDKLNNIAVGAAVGIIGGTVYSTFKAATEPHDFYNLRDYKDGELFAMQKNEPPSASAGTPKLQLSFSF